MPATAEAWLREDVPVAPRSYLADVRARLFRNRAGVISLVVLSVLVLVCLSAALLSPYDPNTGEVANRLEPIGSPGHSLGTDDQGRDMLSRLLWGGQLSLLAGFAPVLIATVLGTALGAFAGYAGGAARSVLMRSLDMFYGLPAILLAIAIAASLGPGLTNVIISVSIVYIAPLARVAETATRRAMVDEYIEAARVSGASTPAIIMTQLLPNIFNPIFVYAAGLVGLSMIIASSLSFLGLGSRPPTPEWGYMLNSLRPEIYVNPGIVLLPGLMIFLTSMAFNTLSDSLRDSMDIKGS
ncbi:MAG: ABC transporter permease [Chloroflexi bacterium]|nr:ABC transporter permease [Chloroflexota bacterium]